MRCKTPNILRLSKFDPFTVFKQSPMKNNFRDRLKMDMKIFGTLSPRLICDLIEIGIHAPIIQMKHGKIMSANVRPCHGACFVQI